MSAAPSQEPGAALMTRAPSILTFPVMQTSPSRTRLLLAVMLMLPPSCRIGMHARVMINATCYYVLLTRRNTSQFPGKLGYRATGLQGYRASCGHQEATLDIAEGRTEGGQQNDVRGHGKRNARKLCLGGKGRDVCSAQAQQATVELNSVPLCSPSTFGRQPCST